MCATSFNIAKRLKNLWKKALSERMKLVHENIYLLEKNWLYIVKNVFLKTQNKCYLYLFTLCFSGNSSHWKSDIINNKARYNWIDAKYRQMVFRSVPTIVPTIPYLESLVKQNWCKFRGLRLHSTSVVILPNWKYFWYQNLPSLIAEMENGQGEFIMEKRLKIGAVQRIENFVSKYLVHYLNRLMCAKMSM